MRSTSKTIYEKKGRGIYRRFFYCVPTFGPTAINRRIRKADTLEGSSKLHTFVGGESGQGDLDTRQLSCYSCDNCKKLNTLNCENKSCFGDFKAQKLSMKSPASVPQTRS